MVTTDGNYPRTRASLCTCTLFHKASGRRESIHRVDDILGHLHYLPLLIVDGRRFDDGYASTDSFRNHLYFVCTFLSLASATFAFAYTCLRRVRACLNFARGFCR